MVDSLKIKNHKEHLQTLIHRADSDSPAAIKDLVDYLLLYKGSSYSDLVLRKGVALLMKHPSSIVDESKWVMQCFILRRYVLSWRIFYGCMWAERDCLGTIFLANDSGPFSQISKVDASSGHSLWGSRKGDQGSRDLLWFVQLKHIGLTDCQAPGFTLQRHGYGQFSTSDSQ